ncbi:hypothetical protein KS18_15880 [Photorhabdus luminescens]|nr:hypothetical protein KS18_15880 [Photorhabdus luminescens]
MTINPLITPHNILCRASNQTGIRVISFAKRVQFIVASNKKKPKIFLSKKTIFIFRIKKDMVIHPRDNPNK